MEFRFQKPGGYMVCIKCYNDTERKFTPFTVKRAGYELTFKEVPAWICPNCEYTYFEESDVEILHNAVANLDEQSETLKKNIVYWPEDK